MIWIMGPGRCGTTFLWELFRNLGYDTGTEAEFLRANEGRLDWVSFPRVIKGTGGLCINFRKHTAGRPIEHVFLCVRAFEPMLESHLKMKYGRGQYKGLSLDELRSRLVEEIPATMGWGLLHAFAYTYSIVIFPASALNSEYLYRVIYRAGYATDRDHFERAWQQTVKPELIR